MIPERSAPCPVFGPAQLHVGLVDHVEAMRVGANDYLTKPINTRELGLRLRRPVFTEELEDLLLSTGSDVDSLALLTRTGAPTVLFITRGFGDLLRIGTQQRPDLFALHIEKPSPLPEVVVGEPAEVGVDSTARRRAWRFGRFDDLQID